MKYVVFFLFLPILTFATTQNEACKAMKNSRMEMDIVSSNIANVSTTKTPEGGPYRRKELVCVNLNCYVKEVSEVIVKYEQDHPDADDNGYVSYPAINLMQEMEAMIQATRNYEVAAKDCK